MQRRSDLAFEAAAAHYAAQAVFPARVNEALLDRLLLVKQCPQVIVDIGAGCGYGSQVLRQHYPKAQILSIDRNLAMVSQASSDITRICADAHQLPLPDASVDMVYANLMMPWGNVARLCREWRRVLRPQGILAFSTYGPDTLKELRMAWAKTDNKPHVNMCFDLHDLGDLLQGLSFKEVVMTREDYTLSFPSPKRAVQEARYLGSHNNMPDQRQGLTTPRQWQNMLTHYKNTCTADGRWPVSLEVVFGLAFLSESHQQKTHAIGPDGTAVIDRIR